MWCRRTLRGMCGRGLGHRHGLRAVARRSNKWLRTALGVQVNAVRGGGACGCVCASTAAKHKRDREGAGTIDALAAAPACVRVCLCEGQRCVVRSCYATPSVKGSRRDSILRSDGLCGFCFRIHAKFLCVILEVSLKIMFGKRSSQRAGEAGKEVKRRWRSRQHTHTHTQ